MAPDGNTAQITCPACGDLTSSLLDHLTQRHPDCPSAAETWNCLVTALHEILATVADDDTPLAQRVAEIATTGLSVAVIAETRAVVKAREAVIMAARSAAALEDAYPPLKAWVDSLVDAEMELATALAKPPSPS